MAKGNIEAIKQPLGAGTDIDGTFVKAGTPGSGGIPLHVAVLAGQMEATKLLHEEGANVNARADDEHGGAYRYPGRTLYIADFDVKTRTVSNPKAITDADPDLKITWLCPRWTNDASAVVNHCNKTGKSQLYMYRLKDGSTARVSTNADANHMFPCGEKTPKWAALESHETTTRSAAVSPARGPEGIVEGPPE